MYHFNQINQPLLLDPLMVQFGSYSPKNIIMESLYKLRGAEQKFSSVAIAHDMTLNERKECKKLVAEAKELATSEASGEYIVSGAYHTRANESNKNQSTKLDTSCKVIEGQESVLKCLLLNACSIRNKINELEVHINNEELDIIAVTETWLTEDVLDSELLIPGFTLYRKDRFNVRDAKGGVVLV